MGIHHKTFILRNAFVAHVSFLLMIHSLAFVCFVPSSRSLSLSQRRGLVARSLADDGRERLHPQQLCGSIRLHPSRRVHNPSLISLLQFISPHSFQAVFSVESECILMQSCFYKLTLKDRDFCPVHFYMLPEVILSAPAVLSCLLTDLFLCGPLWQVVFWEDHSAWLREDPFELTEQARNLLGEGEWDH